MRPVEAPMRNLSLSKLPVSILRSGALPLASDSLEPTPGQCSHPTSVSEPLFLLGQLTSRGHEAGSIVRSENHRGAKMTK